MLTATCRFIAAMLAICVAALQANAYNLAHRWSFTNGSLADSVGSANAQTIRSNSDGVTLGEADAVFDGDAVRLGSDNDASEKATSLNLGTGLVAGNDMTIEIWATRAKLATNMRVFDWGTGGLANATPSHYICVPWNNDVIIWTRGKANSPTISGCFANDVRYHIIMTVKANSDGSSSIHFVRRNLDNPTDVKTCNHTVSGWTLSNVTSGNLYIAHSQWWSERTIDSNATYDEIRLYSGIVGDEQLAANAILGPDVLAVNSGVDAATGFTIPAGATFTYPDGVYPGNIYAVEGTVTLGAGAKIVFDTANIASSSMTFSAAAFSLPSGVSSILDMVELTDSANYEATLSGATITVASKNSAIWTGDAGDGDWQTAGNWVNGKVPDAGTAVTIAGNRVNLSLPSGTTFACASLGIEGGKLTADCDWRGLAVTPTIAAAMDLNGHVLTLNALEAKAGAAFSNSAGDEGEVRFYVDGDPANAAESALVAGIANLTTAENAKIVIVRSNASAASGSLNIGAANNYTVFRAENGTITMTANGNVGTVSGGFGRLEIAGGTLDFGTVNDRGITIGGNGATARAFMNISSGKLRTNWIDVGGANNVECKVVQSGGEVETGASNNGNLWLGRTNGAKDAYEMSGGVINQGTAKSIGSFSVGYYRGASSSFTLTGGTINSKVLDVGTGGTGAFTQNGGEVNSQGDVNVARNSSAVGTYKLDDGDLTPGYWLHVGRNGKGTFTQNGGNVVMTDASINEGNWLSLADSASGNGTYIINDGYLEAGTGAKGGGIFVGRRGTGRFELNGGTVVTSAFIDQTGNSTILLNGGLIKVFGDGGTGNTSQHTGAYGIFTSIDKLIFGANATTIDTDGHNTSVTGCGYSAQQGSRFVKRGSGTLSFDVFPTVDTFVVSNGTVAVSTGAEAATATLSHRWSFNDNYADSVGGSTGTVVGKAEQLSFEESPLGGKMVKLASTNTNNSLTDGASLDLGANVWGVEDVTIEVWARQDAVRNYGRIIDYGYGTANYFYMAWSNGTDGSKDKLGARKDSKSAFDVVGDMSPYTLGTLYHISVSFKRNDDGSTTITWQRRNVATGAVEKSGGRTQTAWTLDNLGAAHFYIGHSQWNSDRDANASYDEVRVWKGILADEALTLSAQGGPAASEAEINEIVARNNVLTAAATGRTLEITSGGTFEIAPGVTFVQSIVKGNGRVAGGTLKVADSIIVKCGKRLRASGTVDLSDAKVVISDPENLSCSFAFLAAPAGESLTVQGEPEVIGLPKGWQLRIAPDSAKIVRDGFVIYIR